MSINQHKDELSAHEHASVSEYECIGDLDHSPYAIANNHLSIVNNTCTQQHNSNIQQL